ncbi:VOC family protein [Phenylobacterium sp. LjRoot225]|uniref:VOC family protein n=1 Tax=Phenylobacterium sp. LjRoot225 TaxID=3342285 RepID=UPI003ED0264F
MRVTGFDHVNIHTDDLPASVRFYSELLGLEPGSAPMGLPPEKARWLCDAEGRAIIHLFNGDVTPGPTGPIDHLALRCAGKAELLDKLIQRGTKFDVFEASPEHTLVFTRDPHGVLLELNFYGE